MGLSSQFITGTPENNRYPCLMRNKHNNIIVLAHSTKSKNVSFVGTVIFGVKDYPIGTYQDNWSEDAFEKFYGTVAIKGD